MPDRMPLGSRDWEAYRDVNERFADTIAERWQTGDLVWIHDYHLLLVPAMLRERCPEARIGLFQHIPFPSSDVFRVLPWRAEILQGMLGADLVGFQNHSDLQHFLTAILRILGVEAGVDSVEWGGRQVSAGVHPIGIDFGAFNDPPSVPDVLAELATAPGVATLLGIDRLDYTKGIPRRLLAVERLFERYPRWRRKVRLLQVAVPSREGVLAYQDLRRQVDELVGRINGEWSKFDWTPIQLVHRSFTRHEVATLYRAANVLLVTPLRDGMNLVAKEFVAARADEDGALVLSEFAGAAAELGEAIVVNPHDVDAVADAIDYALCMEDEERRRRMRALRSRVRTSDVRAWSARFLDVLARTPQRRPTLALDPKGRASLIRDLAGVDDLVVLLDHDGTLAELTPVPSEAIPSDAVVATLGALAAVPSVDVHVVSGRDQGTLSQWYGATGAHLHAEHGAFSAPPGGAWQSNEAASLGPWREPLIAVMGTFAARTAGAFVEEKAVGLAWHYRAADVEFGASMARELRHHLREFLANAPVEVISGDKVVEVRPTGVHKGRVVAGALAARPGASVIAIGDDRTDLDMFAALPADATTIAVGERIPGARYRLADVAAVHQFLDRLVSAKRGRRRRR
jgi:trehalose 6-phosphate synthase/phosphatase